MHVLLCLYFILRLRDCMDENNSLVPLLVLINNQVNKFFGGKMIATLGEWGRGSPIPRGAIL